MAKSVLSAIRGSSNSGGLSSIIRQPYRNPQNPASYAVEFGRENPSNTLSGAKKKVDPGAVRSIMKGGGGSYGGGGGYVETPAPTPAPAEPAVDYAAYMQMILGEQNRVYQEQKAEAKKAYDAQQGQLRASTDNANLAIDKNRDTAVGSMRGETDEQLRQANISRQRAERALPQAAYISGGGGMSESALMDINNTYHGGRDRLNAAFTKAQSDIVNQADNLKASNEQALANNELSFLKDSAQNQANFLNQVPQYALQIARMGPEYAKLGINPMAGVSFKPQAATYAQLKAQGMSDEEIRKTLGI